MAFIVGQTMNARDAPPPNPTPDCLKNAVPVDRITSACQCLSLPTPTVTTTVGIITVSSVHREQYSLYGHNVMVFTMFYFF